MGNLEDTSLVSILKVYIEEVSKDANVVGIALTGSVAREDFDKYSDVDLVIFTNLKNSQQREGKFNFDKYIFDIRICSINILKRMYWSYDMYFAYIYSKIIYDPNYRVRNLIEERKKIWKRNIVHHLIMNLVQLSVIFRFEDNWKGLKADTHYHKSLSRGDVACAHRILNVGSELILDTLYLLNDNPVPDPKNKVKMLKVMTLLSEESISLIDQLLLITSNEKSDVERRYQIISEFVHLIKSSIDSSDKHLPKDFYQYYIKNRV